MEDSFQLILRSKIFSIPTFFSNISDVDPNIYLSLQKNGKYLVKSNVDDSIFNFFIKNWVKNEIPEITNDNFSQYLLLSQEFNRMEDLLNLYQKYSIKASLIAYKNRKLQKHKNKRIEELNKTAEVYQKIIKIIFTKKGINDYYEYLKIKDNLYKSCILGNIDDVISFVSKKINDYDYGLSFILNEEDKTASLYQNLEWMNDIIIPYSVKYKSQEYIVTNKICKFNITDLEGFSVFSLKFEENSKFKEIPCSLISTYHVESLTIPSSVEKFCSGWCRFVTMLNDIKISPKNKNFIYFDDSFILGKSDPKSDIFDVLHFSRRNIEMAKIPSFVKKIKPFAFNSCPRLISIQFSEDSELKSISKSAFDFSSLRNLTLPSSVEKFKCGWCNRTLQLTNIIILKNKKENISMYNNDFILGKIDKKSDIFDVLIFARRNMKEAFIPSFIKKISSYAFEGSSLESIEFSKDSELFSIGENAFSSTKLTSVSIPSNVLYIKQEAFACRSLKTVMFSKESQLEVIGGNAFFLAKIESISIPSHVKIIGKSAFEHCERLKIVEFSKESELKLIEGNAFYNTAIETIKIPSSVKFINENSFGSCSNLQSIDFSDTYEPLFIDKNAFFGSSYLNKIILSSNIHFNGNWLEKTSSLNDVEIIEKENNKLISFYENQFIIEKVDKEFDVLLFSRRNEEIKNYKIPSFIKQIGSYSFSTSKIKEIIIPLNVTQINDFAFSNCELLTRIEFSENSNLKSIGKCSFMSTKINKITIPDHVKIIDDYAFSDCKELEIVEFSDKSELNIIGEYSFVGTKIKIVKIPSHVKKIGQYAFCNCEELQKVEFSKDTELQILNRGLFSSINIESFLVPDSVIVIDDYCFEQSNLKKIEFTNQSKLKSIGFYSFSRSSLKSITLPSSVVDFDENWHGYQNFEELKVIENDEKNISVYNDSFIVDTNGTLLFVRQDIEKVVIPSFIKKIQIKAFLDCNRINEILIPEDSELNEICSFAFFESSINSIFIPYKVTVIHPFTFYGCDKLKYVEFSNNSESLLIEKSAFSDSEIEKIRIPSDVVLADEWCKITPNLNTIEIIEKPNKTIALYENNFILGKSNQLSDQFDVLLFARRDISLDCVTIPPFIQKISPYAFELCEKLNILKFGEDSKLTRIDEITFSETSVNIIYFSSHITEICDYAFLCCENLRKVIFPKNSKLKIIGNNSFYFSSLDAFFVPDNVTRIGDKAFGNSKKLNKIIFSEKSKLKYIGYDAFEDCSITSFSIPPHVSHIGTSAFYGCNDIQILEICENSELKTLILANIFCKYSDICTNHIIVMVPVNLNILIKYK